MGELGAFVKQQGIKSDKKCRMWEGAIRKRRTRKKIRPAEREEKTERKDG